MPLPFEELTTLSRADLHRLTYLQKSVVTRGQLVRAGLPPGLGPRRVRSGRWQAIHRGVYVTHSGPIGHDSLCWAALLAAGRGAVLAHETAAYLDGLQTAQPDRVHLAVPHDHHLEPAPRGVAVHRQRREVQEHLLPPRTTIAATTLDLVQECRRPDNVVGLITTAARRRGGLDQLRRELARRTRTRHRTLLVEMLEPAAEGIESTLERRFDRDVIRRHVLPRMRRQDRIVAGGILMRSDGIFDGFHLRLELDGRTHLDKADADVWRDNATAIEHDDLTLRYRWQHVVTPCRTAAQLSQALTKRGWRGTPRRCGPACRLTSA